MCRFSNRPGADRLPDPPVGSADQYRREAVRIISAENYLFRAPEEGSQDILLLDIEIGAMDGISLAKKIRQSNNTIYLLLLTNLNGFLMLVVTLTSVAGFLVNRNDSQWEYLRKDEKRQFWKHTDYIEKRPAPWNRPRTFGFSAWDHG